MNPWQQGQPGYPQQQVINTGFNNNAPQPVGNMNGALMMGNMPGAPIMGNVPWGPTMGNMPGNPMMSYQAVQPNVGLGYSVPPGNPVQSTGYPTLQTNQGYMQQNAAQCYSTQGYPQTSQIGLPQQYQGILRPGNSQILKWTPTVKPANPFDPRKDATVLRKAMKGLGTDEKSIIQVLTKRTNEQRCRIATEFKSVFGKDLIANLKSETSGRFRDLLVALVTPLPQFYAKELHDAIAGIGTDESVLIEIMCSLSNSGINKTTQAYKASYHSELEADLRGDTSGNFRSLMISLCMGNRSEDTWVDQARAKEDAQKLRKAGELRLGTDESVFNEIFCTRSFPHLKAVLHEYELIAGHDIDKAIKSEFSGDIEKGLLALVKMVRNQALFFAEGLHKSMKGLGTNDRQLIRLMATRCEIDLGDISELFQTRYGEPLKVWIEGDCSGHYKKCLLALLGL